MRTRLAAVLAALCLSACGSSSGVIKMGPDTYMVSHQAGSGFAGIGGVRADCFKDAGEYCSAQKKEVLVIHEQESQPPYMFGNFPNATLQFRCLSDGDPELKRPTLVSEPQRQIIEIRKPASQ